MLISMCMHSSGYVALLFVFIADGDSGCENITGLYCVTVQRRSDVFMLIV